MTHEQIPDWLAYLLAWMSSRGSADASSHVVLKDSSHRFAALEEGQTVFSLRLYCTRVLEERFGYGPFQQLCGRLSIHCAAATAGQFDTVRWNNLRRAAEQYVDVATEMADRNSWSQSAQSFYLATIAIQSVVCDENAHVCRTLELTRRAITAATTDSSIEDDEDTVIACVLSILIYLSRKKITCDARTY